MSLRRLAALRRAQAQGGFPAEQSPPLLSRDGDDEAFSESSRVAFVVVIVLTAAIFAVVATLAIVTTPPTPPPPPVTPAPTAAPYECRVASVNASWRVVADCAQTGVCNGSRCQVSADEPAHFCAPLGDACVTNATCACAAPHCLVDDGTDDGDVLRVECTNAAYTCVRPDDVAIDASLGPCAEWTVVDPFTSGFCGGAPTNASDTTACRLPAPRCAVDDGFGVCNHPVPGACDAPNGTCIDDTFLSECQRKGDEASTPYHYGAGTTCASVEHVDFACCLNATAWIIGSVTDVAAAACASDVVAPLATWLLTGELSELCPFL